MKQNITTQINGPIREAYGKTIKPVEDTTSVVPLEDQEQFLSLLENRVDNQCFFLGLIYITGQLEILIGVEKWLLY
ncbi:MAG: hypothetical protein HC905_25130 [Bacteroidales bacterium]|nr:hypothetical protein [Bacteroidales bacterium]